MAWERRIPPSKILKSRSVWEKRSLGGGEAIDVKPIVIQS
jgi:hypothetical protein